MTRFEGFGTEVCEWFHGLETDNSKEYFAGRREFFEDAIRGEMQALLTELAERFGGEVKMFRQNRDIRFSADKSPYKTSTYGVLRGAGVAAQGLYASISARGLVAGSGYHVMARDQLDRYREAVADDRHGPVLSKLIAKGEKAGLEIWGESLATAPRGYPKEPRTHRPAASQEPVARCHARLRAGNRARRWAAFRDRDVARGRAGHRLA
jgi:uncharacterized protein (TIGR02453 family)